MHAAHAAAVAQVLGRSLPGRFIRRACLPHAEFLALDFGDEALGFGVSPHWGIAVGLCAWGWPRGAPPEILASRLKGARVQGVTAFPGEPIVRVELAGGGALLWEALGRSANLLLLDPEGRVLWAARRLKGPVRSGVPGEAWAPPSPRPGGAEAAPFDAESYLGGEGPDLLHRALLALGGREARAALDREEKALRRGLDAVRADREEGALWCAAAPLGSLLLAAGELSRRGLASLEVTDWAADPPAPVRVPLDPSLTLKQNADALFKKSRRGKARLEKTAAREAELAAKLAAIPPRRVALDQETELSRLFPKSPGRPAGTPRRQERRALPPDVASVPLPAGFAGYAGKSAAGNDAVSFRIGRGSDFWLHASDYPGCHVVVRNPSRLEQLPPEVERAAARYAARHSGAPPGNRLAVHLTQCKFLRRVPGAPGRVMVSRSRTVFVELAGDG